MLLAPSTVNQQQAYSILPSKMTFDRSKIQIAMPTTKSKKCVRNEENLFNYCNTDEISTKSTVLCYINSTLMCLLPIWFYQEMQWIESHFQLFPLLISPFVAYLLIKATRKTQVKMKCILASNLQRKTQSKKKQAKKARSEQLLSKWNHTCDLEASICAIFYNNSLFMAIFVFTNFILIRPGNPLLGLFVSGVGSSGVLACIT